MQKITLYLDLPEMTSAEREALRGEIAGALGRVWPKAGWSWLWAVGEPPTDEMAKALLAGRAKAVKGFEGTGR